MNTLAEPSGAVPPQCLGTVVPADVQVVRDPAQLGHDMVPMASAARAPSAVSPA